MATLLRRSSSGGSHSGRSSSESGSRNCNVSTGAGVAEVEEDGFIISLEDRPPQYVSGKEISSSNYLSCLAKRDQIDITHVPSYHVQSFLQYRTVRFPASWQQERAHATEYSSMSRTVQYKSRTVLHNLL